MAKRKPRQKRPTDGTTVSSASGRATKVPKSNPAVAARLENKGRSGGVVDAPGKKHRKPAPSDPGANIADSQAAKLRMVKTMVKSSRHRGRG